jgi:MSHA biogenesis protein MshK
LIARLIALLLLGASGLACAAILDPTQPPAGQLPGASEAKSEPLVLQAVMRGIQGPRAVINGAMLKVGGQVADAKVIAIYPYSVLIERQGQRQLLRLTESVLQPSR